LRALDRLPEAMASYRRVLELQPDHIEAHHNLGNALFAAGQFEDAAAQYRRVLDLDPNVAEAHGNLGNALRSLGRYDEAILSYRRALALKPQFAAAHSNLSDALRDVGRLDEAMASSRRAIELDPEVAGAYNTLGNALLDSGALDAAVAAYRRALVLDPEFTAAATNLGMALRLLGHAAEAEVIVRRALESQPENVAALVLLAELQADAGCFADAQALFERASTIDPNSPDACAGIAHLRKMTSDDAAWAERAERIADRPLPPRQEAGLRYALGKYRDDIKHYEQAFSEYRRANELTKRFSPAFDAGRLTHRVDELLAGGTRPVLSRNEVPESTRAVFIVGMPRSGTTLAEQILAAHPAIFGAGELPFWSTAAGGDLADRGAEYLRTLRQLAPDALRVVDKMPANVWSLGAIHAALPDARIIHMRRDPRDTCLSIYFQQFRTGHPYANDLQDLRDYFQQYRRVIDHWRAVLPAGTLLDVSYEDLVDDPERWTRTMLEFIGMPWDPRCLEFHESGRSVMTASKWQVRQKISRTAVARWRNYEEFLGPLQALVES